MAKLYRPDINAQYWEAVGDFVSDVISEVAGAIPYTERDLSLAASRLALWAWQTAGLPLERDIVFDRDVIARFIAVGCPEFTPAVRGNIRSQLLRISEALPNQTKVVRRLQPLAAANPSAPYSATDVVSLRSWAGVQSTASRQSNAGVLLALGLGAGLSASEIGWLRVKDINVDSQGVTVRVQGPRDRTVPVLREWTQQLSDRRAEIDPERFAFRPNHGVYYPNLVSNFVDRSHVVGVRPQTQRMRSTWIIRHLAAGTPVVPLMRAAGVDSLEALTRYLRFVPEPDREEARGRLSGA